MDKQAPGDLAAVLRVVLCGIYGLDAESVEEKVALTNAVTRLQEAREALRSYERCRNKAALARERLAAEKKRSKVQ